MARFVRIAKEEEIDSLLLIVFFIIQIKGRDVLGAASIAVQEKLAALPIKVQLVLPDGEKIGDSQPQVCLRIKELSTLAHLAAGQVGVLGQD